MLARIVTLIVALLIVMPAVSAHGQGITSSTRATPTPAAISPTPAVPAPDGRALLRLTQQALIKEKTVRISETSLSTWNGHWVSGVTWMDVDFASNTLREVDTIQRVRTGASRVAMAVERRVLVVAGGSSANRAPRSAWSCEQLPGVQVKNGLVVFQLRASIVRNLGSEMARGVRVWHVRAINAQVPAWSANAAMVDLYIAQSDDTLVRLNLRAAPHLGGTIQHEKVAETYRRYGEAVTVVVPKQCRERTQ